MNVPDLLLRQAQDNQTSAACDAGAAVRLIAGPGSGKSRVIRDRVLWLVAEHDVDPEAICAVSFTRASAGDLGNDVGVAWRDAGLGDECPVRVSTLHALALRILRAADQLAVFAVRPRVLDAWEMKYIFDCEYKDASGLGADRRKAIRLDHEAFWSTGDWLPPGLPAPEPPITAAERTAFDGFYRSRSSLYCHLLPSDITRRCYEFLSALPLEAPLPILLAHLVVDEYQDLNPVDLALIREIASRNVSLFVAGDDDQSVYFFRYAMAAGIRRFPDDYPIAPSTHMLSHCFRCPDEILTPALGLLDAYASSGRIPKDYIAVPSAAVPAVVGQVHRWYFKGWRLEADSIAASCRDLIAEGVRPSRIAILLSSRPTLERTILESLESHAVAYEVEESERYVDTNPGRLALSLVRIVADPDDYVALRTLLGVLPGVGAGTCRVIADWVVDSAMRYGDILVRPIPDPFGARARGALETLRGIAGSCEGLGSETPVVDFSPIVAANVERLFGKGQADGWRDLVAASPAGATIGDACRLITSPTLRAQRAALTEIAERLGEPAPEPEEEAVRVLTLHGSKGLTFDVVFIPGLESGSVPSEHALPYSGLVQEAARLLYVGMTRARVGLILSMSNSRQINGTWTARTPTPFVGSLGGRFDNRDVGLDHTQCAMIREGLAVIDA